MLAALDFPNTHLPIVVFFVVALASFVVLLSTFTSLLVLLLLIVSFLAGWLVLVIFLVSISRIFFVLLCLFANLDDSNGFVLVVCAERSLGLEDLVDNRIAFFHLRIASLVSCRQTFLSQGGKG